MADSTRFEFAASVRDHLPGVRGTPGPAIAGHAAITTPIRTGTAAEPPRSVNGLIRNGAR